MNPYYTDGTVTLYLGDMRDVLPALDVKPDCVVTDPPYAETSLAWDKWPDGWPSLVADVTQSMWCFGSLRMFLDRRDEFFPWKLSQDVVWEKQQGAGLAADRFNRVHEFATHWYRGTWSDVYHHTPRDGVRGPAKAGNRSGAGKAWRGEQVASADIRDGSALIRSVIKVRNMNGRSTHPTEKPLGILGPLITYACPPGGTVLDVFAGSGSTAEAARMSGRKAVLIEGHEPYCEAIAKRLDQDVLDFGGAA